MLSAQSRHRAGRPRQPAPMPGAPYKIKRRGANSSHLSPLIQETPVFNYLTSIFTVWPLLILTMLMPFCGAERRTPLRE